MKYKNTQYRVMRSSFGTVNVVIVWFGSQTYRFETIEQAKNFISTVTGR